MKVNTSKERNFYTQGQQFAAKVLCIIWLLASGSPESVLATPKRQMVPATTTSPGDPSLASTPPKPLPGGILQLPPDSPGSFWGSGVASTPAMESTFQERMSQEAVPFIERDLLRTSPKATPASENLSFQARGGESVRFHYQMGQWRAEVSSHLGAFSRQAVLPVVCSQGEDVTSSLEVLSKYPSWQSQCQIHVLDRKVCPTLGEVVYLGELGLKGGVEREASGSGEPALSSQTASLTDHPTTTTTTPISTSSSAKGEEPYRPQLATRVSGPGLDRRDQLAESKGPTQLDLDQIEAKRLKEQIDQRYPKLLQPMNEADAQQLVEELITPLERLVELEGFWSEDSLGKTCAQDYLVKLREGAKSRKLALDQARDQQLIRLLERSYSGSLKQLVSATASSQSVQLIEVLEKLAALSSDQGGITQDLSHYTDAAILYQHILSICVKEQDTLDSQETSALQNAAYQGLAQLQATMLAQAKEVDATTQADVATLQKRMSEDRNELEAFRADVKPRATALINNLEDILSDQGSSDEAIKQAEEAYIQSSQALFGEIAQRVSEFLAKLYQESELALGPAPCKYAVMGLGSMALQQITPYSDLEFAIVMEDAPDEATTEAWRTYFRKLTHLVHFRVINLGETVVPFGKYKLSLDHLGKRGFNFDLGGKTPLGRRDKPYLKTPYELIQPVSGMVYYLHNEEDKIEHMDKLLPYILESTCYVHGDSSLHERYVAAKRAFLLESQDASGKPAYQKRALKKLVEGVVEMDYRNPEQTKPGRRQVGDLEDFEPKFGDEAAGRLYDVKQEIYRLPDRLLYRLAMYYGILPTSGWDAIDQLAQRGIIGVGGDAQQAAHHLHYAVSFATMLRLQTYLHHGQQFEQAKILNNVSQEEEVRQVVQAAFTLSESSLQADGSLFRYYYTALPLHRKVKELLEAPNQEGSFFQQALFYDSSAETRAAIHQRMLQHKEAKNCYEEALATQEQHYGPNNPDIAGVLNNLGNAWRALGDARKAVSSYERALAILEQGYQEVPNHPEMAATLNNLGNAWRDLGEAHKAVNFYERALAILEQGYQEAPNHPEMAATLNNLGNAWRDLGEAHKAVNFYERALAILEQGYKELPNHSEIAATLNNLGEAWRALGDVRKAVSSYERALAILEQGYQETPNHPEIAGTLNNLGMAWYALGEARKAVSFFERALAVREQVCKEAPNHPDIASTLNNLGAAWSALGDARKAVSFLERALAIYEQVYKEASNHPDIASTLNNLGNASSTLGKASKAVNFYGRALAILEQVYKEDPNHPVIAGALNNLGMAWSALGDTRKAVSFFERALAIKEQVYKETPNHPSIAATLNNLGVTWSALGDARKVVSFYQRALAIKEQVYKETPNHPKIAMTLKNLGTTWSDLGDARKAVSFFERALAIYEQVYKEAPNHPVIASVLKSLGAAWRALGDARKAVSFFERALEIYKQVHRPNHPDVAKTLMDLEVIRRALGEDTQVASFANQFIKACREGDSESLGSIPISSLSKDLYDNQGNPLVCWMVQHEMTATLAQVLALGWSPNLPNVNQVYPIHYGVLKSPSLVQLFLPYADPFVQTAKGNTPAMVVLSKSKMEVLKVLLPAIPNLSFKNSTKFKASYATFKQRFMEASVHGDAPSLEHLVRVFTLACHFKDWELAQAVAARHNLRPILSQVTEQYPGAAKSLLACVDSFTEACREGKDALAVETAGQFTFEKDLYDNEDNSLISWMAQHEMTATLEKVLALGWNPNLPNANQVYPLHYGAMKNVAVARLLLQAGAHPFVQTAKESTPAMVAKKKENLQTLALLLPTQAMLSFADLATFEASYQAYKGRFTPSAAGNEELLVALELALQLGDAALLQVIGTSRAEDCLFQLTQKYPLAAATIQMRFRRLLASPSS